MSVAVVPEKPRAIEVLRSNSLLQALRPEQLESLASHCRLVWAERGEMIWYTGADVDYFGMSADGFIKMSKGCPSGTDVTLELMGPGQIFGLMGVITGTGCPLSAFAVTDLWYVRIPKRAFLEVYHDCVPIKDKLIHKSSLRLHGAVNLMARMSSGRVDERIAAILFVLAESYGRQDREGIRLDCPLTRQEIAEMAGTTVESTIRVMSRWQRLGIISTSRQHVVIRDDAELARVLSF